MSSLLNFGLHCNFDKIMDNFSKVSGLLSRLMMNNKETFRRFSDDKSSLKLRLIGISVSFLSRACRKC